MISPRILVCSIICFVLLLGNEWQVAESRSRSLVSILSKTLVECPKKQMLVAM
jgi:hypothetical protein